MYASRHCRKEGSGRISGSGGERIGIVRASMLAEEWRERRGDSRGCEDVTNVVEVI